MLSSSQPISTVLLTLPNLGMGSGVVVIYLLSVEVYGHPVCLCFEDAYINLKRINTVLLIFSD